MVLMCMGFSFFSWGARKKNQRVVILTYNTQIGVRGWGFVEGLLKEKADIVCFQRFPEKWLSKIAEACTYQPSYKGCDNGCVTIHRESKLVGKGHTQDIDFGRHNSQSTAFIESELNGMRIINSLPPYPEEAEKVSEVPYKKHLNVLFERQGRIAIVGDMHFDRMDFSDVRFNGFKNHSQGANFTDQQGRGLNLTKLFLNFDAKVNQRVLSFSTEPQRHSPVIFEIN